MKWSSILITITAFLFLMLLAPVSADTADDVKCIGCVSSPDIMDGGVKNPDIAAGVVTTSKIKDGAVDKTKIKKGSVGWDHLVASLRNRIKELEATLAEVQAELHDTQEQLSANTVLKLDGYLDLDTTDPEKPTARFSGVNVQVVNGLNLTTATNGLGNLIVGYDDQYPYNDFICALGYYDNQKDCEAQGEIWAVQHKSGSHNLVVGRGHRYSRYGGLIGGSGNAVNGDSASVTGGQRNIASGWVSSVAGGYTNRAGGEISAVSGGSYNIASGEHAVVSGGLHNTASSYESVVSGGIGNTASNTGAVVSGGFGREASSIYNWAAGGLWQAR